MSGAARLGGAAAWTMASRVVRFLTGIALSIVVVRGLGPDDYGRLVVVRTILAFVSVLCYGGLGQAVLRFLPERAAHGDIAGARRLLAFAVLTQAGVWLLVSLLVPWIIEPIDRAARVEVGSVLAVGCALLAADLAVTVLHQAVTAWYELRAYSVATSAAGVVLVAGTWLALRAGFGVIGVLAVSAAANAAIAVVLLITLRRVLRRAEDTAAPVRDDAPSLTLGRVLRYSLPFTAIGVLNLIVWRQSETILLGHFRGARDAGIYDLAYRTPQQILEFIPATLWPLVMAGISEAYTRDAQSLGRTIRTYYTFLFALVPPIALAGAVVSAPAVPILFGDEMRLAGPYAAAFFVLFAVSFLGTPLSMGLYVLERTSFMLLVYAVQAIVSVGLDLLLIPRWGILGAVIPVSVVVCCAPLVYGVALSRRIGTIPVPWRFIARSTLAHAGWLLLAPLALRAHSVAHLTVTLLGGVVLSILGVRLLRVVGPEQVALLARARVPHRALWTRVLGVQWPAETGR